MQSNIVLFLFAFVALLYTGCSKSDDQRQFEREALVTDNNITRTTNNGDVDSLETDPNDWRIGPMYQGLINIGNFSEPQPPFPNPVGFNSTLHIYLTQLTPDEVNILEIYKLTEFNDRQVVKLYDEFEINSTFNDLRIPAHLIADGEGSGANGTYRILIYDGRGNLITYGDVEVQ